MEIFYILVGIAYLLLPIVLLVSHLGLKKEVRQLSEKMNEVNTSKRPTLQKTGTQSTQTVPFTASPSTPSAPMPPSSFDLLINWLKVDWPMKTGAFLLLLGFGWVATYAFMHNWIGPVGRISLGIASGVVILALGEWRNKTSIPQGSILVALGASVILVTTYAARTVYDFFTPEIALVFMALVVIFVAYSSVKRRIFSLGVLGLLMGGGVPLLVGSTDPSFVNLFAYLFVLCAGTIWVVGLTGWRIFNVLSLGIVTLYTFIYLEGSYFLERNLNTEFLFASAFAALFLISNVARMLKNKEVSRDDLITAVGNALLFLFWINQTISEEWKSLVSAAAMLVFFVAAYLLFKKTAVKESIYTYGLVTFVFLITATRFELQDDTLFILAYTLETAAVTAAAMKLMKGQKEIHYAVLLLVPAAAAGLLSLDGPKWDTGIAHTDFLVLLTNTVSLLAFGLYFYKQKWEEHIAFFLAGGFYAVAWIWLTSDALIADPEMGVMAALTVYTLAGLGLNLIGSAKEITIARQTGAILIGMVVIRLLTIDIWHMDITGKIITFFVIGSLLISTAFLSKKLAHS